MRINKLAKQVEDAVKNKPVEKSKRPNLFSTGSTLLNLACSDYWKGAFLPGMVVNIVGDSHAGKTFLGHSIMAEAALNPAFKNYNFYHDNAEAATTDGIRKMFGKTLINKLHPPSKEGHSSTIQEWRNNIWKIIQKEEPFIYLTDSLDSLDSNEAEERLNNVAAGKGEKGSYKMEKPKILSEVLGTVCRKMEKTNSLLIILSQTRDNINPMSFKKKTRSGGRALEFYSSIEMWLGRVGSIKSSGENKRAIGNKVRIKVTKTKLTGKIREIDFPIYNDYGIDDIGSCVDFMINEGIWKKDKLKYKAKELGLFATREKIIATIEEKSLEDELKREVGQAWRQIENSIKLNRKPRYS